MKKRYRDNNSKVIFYGSIIVMCCVIFITIGYSAFSTELSMSGISAVVRVQKDIRISSLKISNTTSDAYSNYEEYNVKKY